MHCLRGSQYQHREVSVPKYHVCNGFRDPKATLPRGLVVAFPPSLGLGGLEDSHIPPFWLLPKSSLLIRGQREA